MLDSLLDDFSKTKPNKTAIIDANKMQSWQDIVVEVDKFVTELKVFGYHSLTMLLLPQLSSSVSLLVACAKLKLDVILVSEFYGESNAEKLMEEFSASQLITVRNGKVIELARNTKSVGFQNVISEPFVYVLTSGSTGQPKCAKHTWTTLTAAVKKRANFEDAIWLLGYPVAHFSGLQVLGQSLLNASTIAIPKDFSVDSFANIAMNHKVEYLTCTPTYLRQLLMSLTPNEWSKTSLQHITLGGEIVEQQILEAIKLAVPKIKITHIYASTELGELIAVKDGKEGFDAALLDEKKLKIIDGELFASKSTRSMFGYKEQPALEREWVATGDKVEVVNSRVKFLGRIDDIINVGGFKVNPTVLERAIRQIPGVVDIYVVGQRSSIVGNLVKAIVLAEKDAEHKALEIQIRQHCAKLFPDYMVPRLFEFPDKFERTISQKLLRRHHL